MNLSVPDFLLVVFIALLLIFGDCYCIGIFQRVDNINRTLNQAVKGE